MYVYFNPSQDYSGNSEGDFIFRLGNIGNKFRLLGWKGPFTSGIWDNDWFGGDVTSDWGVAKSAVEISPDFPSISPHLTYKFRVNLDKMQIGNSWGFAEYTWDFKADTSRVWPIELAQNGFRKSNGDTNIIPSYSGTASLSLIPATDLSQAVETFAGLASVPAVLSRRECLKNLRVYATKLFS